jgi:hypothetical protein
MSSSPWRGMRVGGAITCDFAVLITRWSTANNRMSFTAVGYEVVNFWSFFV